MSQVGETRGKIVLFIYRYIDIHGYAPSYEEIGEYIGLKSKSSVQHHILKLFEEGRLATDLDCIRSRAYRVERLYASTRKKR